MANSKSNTLASRYTFLYVLMYVLYTTFKFSPWKNSAKKIINLCLTVAILKIQQIPETL